MKFQEMLEKLDACDEAREWVGNHSLQEAWEVCDRPEWLMLLAKYVNIPQCARIEAMCVAIRAAIHLYDPDLKWAHDMLDTVERLTMKQCFLNAGRMSEIQAVTSRGVERATFWHESLIARALDEVTFDQANAAKYISEMDSEFGPYVYANNACDQIRRIISSDDITEACNQFFKWTM